MNVECYVNDTLETAPLEHDRITCESSVTLPSRPTHALVVLFLCFVFYVLEAFTFLFTNNTFFFVKHARPYEAR